MGYAVEQLDASPPTGELLAALWTRNLQMRGEPRDKFTWFYQGNPAGAATAFVLRHTADTTASAIVGGCGLGTRNVLVGGRQMTAGLMADFSVDSAHRTVMPALLLQRALCTEALRRYPLAYAFPNAAAVGIFGRIGFQPLGRMRRFVKVLRSAHYLRNRIPAPVAAVAGPPLDLVSRVGEATRVLSPGTRRYQLNWVTDVDDRFDRLWQRVSVQLPFIGVRDSAFLRWRFVTRPGRPGQIAALVDAAGELQAYAAIIEKQPGMAFLADFLASSDAALSALLNQLVVALRRKPYHAITTVFMGPENIQRVLSASGFQRRGEAKFAVIGKREDQADHAALPSKPEDAYLTEADRDN